MRAVIQRVKRASVSVDGELLSSIERGVMVLIGVGVEDTEEDCAKVARKIVSLRLWPDETGQQQWKRSVSDIGGKVLCVSQFTLLGRVNKGAKPDFHQAAKGEHALRLYQHTRTLIGQQLAGGMANVGDGRFGAMMDVELVNDGPVTIEYDTR